MEPVVLILIALYFLPWMIAAARNHNNTTAIFMLNIFLGWTFAGWVIALVWSFMAIPEKMGNSPPIQPRLNVETPKTCQWCMALNSRAFRHCSGCGRPLP